MADQWDFGILWKEKASALDALEGENWKVAADIHFIYLFCVSSSEAIDKGI